MGSKVKEQGGFKEISVVLADEQELSNETRHTIHTFIPARGRQRQIDVCEFEARLVCVMSSV